MGHLLNLDVNIKHGKLFLNIFLIIKKKIFLCISGRLMVTKCLFISFTYLFVYKLTNVFIYWPIAQVG